MRNGVFQTATQRVFRHQISHLGGHRVRLPYALIGGVLALGIAASVTLAQEQPQPAPPQPTGMGPSEPERQWDAQAQELETRRAELQRSLQQAEMKLQQLMLEQDQQRRALQKELGDMRERLRAVESQLADLPRQRLRAKYLAALQTLEQARTQRRQAEEQAEAARLAEQDASVVVDRLRQLLQQMPPAPPESVRAEPPGPAAGEPRGKPDNAEIPGDGLVQQLEGLRGGIRDTGERIQAVAAQVDITRETLNREITVVRTDLQRMGRTLGRIERERLEAQGNLRTSVEELRGHLEQVQQLCQAQRTLDIALMQPHISTVGSAAYR